MIQGTQDLTSDMDAKNAAHRPRFAVAFGVAAVALLLLTGAQGLGWDEGPAIVLGEVAGMLAPIAVFALAAMALHALWSRFTVR